MATNLPSKRKDTADKLSSIASTVARYLALGLDYEDIAVQTGLPIDSISKVARGNLVKKRVKEISKDIDERVIEDAAADPVTLFLKGKSMKAAATLVAESENYDKEEGGATASTRISASKEVLALAGYKAQEASAGPSAVIMISADKVELGQAIIKKTSEVMPDFVDG